MKTMRSMKSSSSSEKREFIKERDNSLHQARKEGNPSRRDKILRKHQAVQKKRGSFQKKKKKREREKWMQEFSSSCERILIHQKTQEIWDSMKDHSS